MRAINVVVRFADGSGAVNMSIAGPYRHKPSRRIPATIVVSSRDCLIRGMSLDIIRNVSLCRYVHE